MYNLLFMECKTCQKMRIVLSLSKNMKLGGLVDILNPRKEILPTDL